MREKTRGFCGFSRADRAGNEPRGGRLYGGKESPDQIGLWLGGQMVDHYMKSHPQVTIGELLRMSDYKKMLRESGYHPTVKKK